MISLYRYVCKYCGHTEQRWIGRGISPLKCCKKRRLITVPNITKKNVEHYY